MLNQDERIKAVPIWQKSNLTLEEAAAYTGIGINKLRDMSTMNLVNTSCGSEPDEC